ncbi:bifunctional folylpolyglutamate synthase/dihydrofolate synthase [Caldisalinibacter kiritimatiensis]|uniref:tetrahydrofolate synthase n=1 Tax=Caldisalinibacter kiritimatiensis TaxID=1304284 RepID=R1AQV6_9FIRM|nr:folylpolyglutamate synthase/dihydrofolate synthase family protein [Caldisalinibacter kiritimatiensis]EOC99497.1 Dihydrofolate synthase / Folylpolyglutamate synthase [Caldisalinibacter kiritimatiensis]
MKYNEALEYIHSTRKFGSKLGLENIRKLLELLGNPHKELKIIHIAGTNGKGSTSSFIASILKEGNFKVGLFTSPYLEKFTERIRINGEYIKEEELAEITEMVKDKVKAMLRKGYNHPTEFEIVTAIAFMYYKKQKVDYVVLEVGLGGRYDSTNIIDTPLASVITPISLDHMHILGDTLGKIAYEKAGIIKDNSIVICHPQENEAIEVIKKVAKEKSSEIIIAPINNARIENISSTGSEFSFKYRNNNFKRLNIRLLGRHQINNAIVALITILELKEKGLVNISYNSIIKGLENTKWKGRLEVLMQNPTFVIDGAHNRQGSESLKKAITELFKYDRLILGMGILRDKEVEYIIQNLAPLADQVIVTEANSPRTLKAEELAESVREYNENIIIKNKLESAIDRAFDMADKKDLIVFSGSLYLIGDVRKYIKNK